MPLQIDLGNLFLNLPFMSSSRAEKAKVYLKIAGTHGGLAPWFMYLE